MLAGGTVLERLAAEVDVPAFPANPVNLFFFFEDPVLFHIVEEFPVPFLMMLFNLGDQFVSDGDFRKTFLGSHFRKCRV